jgi:hypothetical protein
MRWTTLRQKRDQTMSEYTNIFHTLRSKLGIKDKDPNPNLDPDSKNDQMRQIIDVEPTSIVTTTIIQPEEDPKEGE